MWQGGLVPNCGVIVKEWSDVVVLKKLMGCESFGGGLCPMCERRKGLESVPDYHCFGRSEVWDCLSDLSLEVILIP